MRTIFLIWTLIAGEPHDVDAFLTQEACLAAKTQWSAMLDMAKSQRPELANYSLVGCESIEVGTPPAPPVKQESA